jgi:hypothetical protein
MRRRPSEATRLQLLKQASHSQLPVLHALLSERALCLSESQTLSLSSTSTAAIVSQATMRPRATAAALGLAALLATTSGVAAASATAPPATVTLPRAGKRYLPPGPLNMGYAPNCNATNVLRAIQTGLNVVFWFAINIDVNATTGAPAITGAPDLDCVAAVASAARARGLPTTHMITVGGWDGACARVCALRAGSWQYTGKLAPKQRKGRTGQLAPSPPTQLPLSAPSLPLTPVQRRTPAPPTRPR